ERRVLGPGHIEAMRTASNAVESLLWLRRYAEAEPLAREAFAGKRAGYGADHPSTVEAMTDLGVALAGLGRRDEAETRPDEALVLRPRLAGRGRSVADAMVGMARLAAQLGRKDLSLKLLKEVLDSGIPAQESRRALEQPLLAPLHGDPRFEALLAEA